METLGRFSAIFSQGKHFVFSCFFLLHIIPYLKWVYYKRKGFAPKAASSLIEKNLFRRCFFIYFINLFIYLFFVLVWGLGWGRGSKQFSRSCLPFECISISCSTNETFCEWCDNGFACILLNDYQFKVLAKCGYLFLFSWSFR